jgi:PPP family 3-phenylpropionic acid transporter
MASIGELTRRFGQRWLFVLGCGIYLVIYIAWAFVSNPMTAALLKLVGGVAFALTFVSAVMIANDLVPSRLRATGQTLMKSVMFGVAPVLGAVGGGFVYGVYGSRTMFLASSVLVTAAAVTALFFVPSPARERIEEAALPGPEVSPATP